MPAIPVSVYLLAIVMVVALPLGALSAGYLLRLNAQEERALEQRTIRQAQTIASAIGSMLHDMNLMITVLASSPELEMGDYAGFHQRTQRALMNSGWYMLLLDSQGTQMLNTRVPYGSVLGKTSNLEAFEKAMQSDRVIVSNGFFGETAKQWVFNVLLRVDLPGSQTDGVVVLTQNAVDLLPALRSVELGENWSIILVDGNGIIMSEFGELEIGDAIPENLPANLQGVPEFVTGSFEDRVIVGADAPVPGSNWSVIIWGPRSTGVSLDVVSTLKTLLFWFSLSIVIALTLAFVLGRALNRAMIKLARLARRVGGGNTVEPLATGVLEINVVAEELSRASDKIQRAEAHATIIRRELVHRIKNLFAVIQATLRQTEKSADTQLQFRDRLSERLVSLSRSIDLLVSENWGGVSLQALIRQQTDIFDGAPDRILVEGDDLKLKTDAVQTLGMAFHELTTNALKHGALSKPDGNVAVKTAILREPEKGPILEILWKESGGPRVSKPKKSGFGRTVVQKHAATVLGGDVDLCFQPAGLTWILRVPAENIQPQNSEMEL